MQVHYLEIVTPDVEGTCAALNTRLRIFSFLSVSGDSSAS